MRFQTRRGIALDALLLAVILAGACGLLLTACSRSQSPAGSAETKTLYSCGMHPQVVQDHPGNCPICGMKLTPIRKAAGANAVAANPGGAAGAGSSIIAVDAVTTQNMGIRTATITRGPLRRAI